MSAKITHIVKQTLVVTGVLLYNWVFWGESLGINLLMFTLFVIGAVFFAYPAGRGLKTVLFTAAGALIGAGMTVVFNSTLAEFTAFTSMLLMVGFAIHAEVKTVHNAWLIGLVQLSTVPARWVKALKVMGGRRRSVRAIWKWTRILIIPLAILLLFFGIYTMATPALEDITDSIGERVGLWIDNFFEYVPIARLFFILAGLWLLHGLIYGGSFMGLVNWEGVQLEKLVRTRKDKLMWRRDQVRHILRRPIVGRPAGPPPPPPPGVHVQFQPPTYHAPRKPLRLTLLTEYRVGILTLILLNLLIGLVNGLDVYHLWFRFDPEVTDMTQMVHSGTYLLILAIILSMGVIMYFFRGNLNFFKQNRPLRILGSIWMAQNALMAISVAVKNWHYVDWFGLAYGRIEVYAFVFLALVGMVTLGLKIKHRHTFWLLVRRNTWVAYGFLLAACFVNWDVIIVKYNLQHPQQQYMNVPYNLNLSDKTLHLIDQHNEILDYENDQVYNQMFSGSWSGSSIRSYDRYWEVDYHEHYRARVEAFLEKKETESWLSWNWAEAQTMRYLQEHKVEILATNNSVPGSE